MAALSREGARLCANLGYAVGGCEPQIGLEQEFFLVPREAFYRRPDLQLTGRTVLGRMPPRGQEMCDHYMAPPNRAPRARRTRLSRAARARGSRTPLSHAALARRSRMSNAARARGSRTRLAHAALARRSRTRLLHAPLARGSRMSNAPVAR